MTAMNVVRMKVKPGQEKAYLDAQNDSDRSQYQGMRSVRVVKTGEREYIIVGEWDSMDALVAARPAMIATLDRIRGMLEDMGGDLGVTDPRSGEVVLSF
ncbi:antibiotic biosynthesis monooxygenase family protein [Defluviimonas sp. SAOS-178_SWC]|uniref:antibiotic biosynthesis monooxygenase family protein n=1 Tax=Defluviimonas sp. SAOS-178_SWC TaxID=3121287 RepID=UPI0032215708